MPTLTKIFTMEEASEHKTPDDCWVVIDGKVYDVSSYLEEHPGGDDVLLRATGKDATEEFEDAGHSRTARELMEEFCIGEIYEEASTLIPELTITHKKSESEGLTSKVLRLSKQYWVFPVSVVSLSVVVVGFLHLRRRRNS